MTTPLFEFIVAQGPEGSTVYLGGEIDLAATLEVAPRLDEIAQGCTGPLVFDLSGVTFLDSEGIKMLLVVFDQVLQRGGKARLVRISERARRVMEMAGVAEILTTGNPQASPRHRQFAWRVPGSGLGQQQ